MLGKSDGDGTVRIADDLVVHGQEGGRAVMIGPVEFDAAADPGAESTDERGLDNVLTVKEIIACDLVVGFKDTSAQLGDQRNADAKTLLNYGFSTYGLLDVSPEEPPAPVPVTLGAAETVQPVLPEGQCVLEVKYDKIIPSFIPRLLEGIPKDRSSVSKYCRCLSIGE